MTSAPVIALIIAQTGYEFCVRLINLNKYMHDVHNVKVKDNGYYTSTPYIAIYASGKVQEWNAIRVDANSDS